MMPWRSSPAERGKHAVDLYNRDAAGSLPGATRISRGLPTVFAKLSRFIDRV
jgi:hypothetical protein